MKALLAVGICLSYTLVGAILSLPYGLLAGAQTKGEFISMTLLLPLVALCGLILLVMAYPKIGDLIMSRFIKRYPLASAGSLSMDKETLSYVKTVFWVYAVWMCLPIICNGLSIAALWLNLESVGKFIFISRYFSLFLAMIAILAVVIVWSLAKEMIWSAKAETLRPCQ
jgi:hypothetical protein